MWPARVSDVFETAAGSPDLVLLAAALVFLVLTAAAAALLAPDRPVGRPDKPLHRSK